MKFKFTKRRLLSSLHKVLECIFKFIVINFPNIISLLARAKFLLLKELILNDCLYNIIFSHINSKTYGNSFIRIFFIVSTIELYEVITIFMQSQIVHRHSANYSVSTHNRKPKTDVALSEHSAATTRLLSIENSNRTFIRLSLVVTYREFPNIHTIITPKNNTRNENPPIDATAKAAVNKIIQTSFRVPPKYTVVNSSIALLDYPHPHSVRCLFGWEKSPSEFSARCSVFRRRPQVLLFRETVWLMFRS